MKKIADPIPYAACFTLDLYCDSEGVDHKWQEFPHQFTGHDKTETFRRARDKGWILHRDRTATCPKCAQKRF